MIWTCVCGLDNTSPICCGCNRRNEVNDRTIKWDDGAVIHSCQGERIAPYDQKTFLVWTDCGKDVPADKGFRSDSVSANCSGCSAAIKQEGVK